MKVLVACEESQAVTTELRRLGHEAYSCDIIECSGGHPEWHIKGDVLKILNPQQTFEGELKGIEFFTTDGELHSFVGEWDMIIAHPPCTYLTNGGAVRVFRQEFKDYPPYGKFQMVNVERVKQGMIGRDLFMAIMYAHCDKIAIENPIPMSIYMLPPCQQIVQPYEYGDPYSKRTCLWLKGLPKLQPTNVLQEFQPFINGGGGRMHKPNYKGKKFASGSTNRSKTFPGIARAMAEQWAGESEELK